MDAEQDFAWGVFSDSRSPYVSVPGGPPRLAFVHPSAVIGDGTIIYPGVYIGPDVTIGADCVVGPGVAIGQPGFGYERQPDGRQAYREHSAGVEIGDDVHIGANACIDQGRYRPTRVGRGTRIDDLCFLAHNVEVGEDCLVIAHSMLAGSVEIGDQCHIGPAAFISDHIIVGRRARVGLGAVVIRDVPENVIVVGNPAKVLRERGADE